MAIGNTSRPTVTMSMGGPITDMVEESGLPWLARAMRGDAAMPQWLAVILQNGPPNELPLVLGELVQILANDGTRFGTYVMRSVRTEESIRSLHEDLHSTYFVERPNINVEFAFVESTE